MAPVYAYPCIPPDLSTDILSYLPAKSLLRFRSVSKYWKSTIDNPEFTSLHSSRYANTHKYSHNLIVFETNSSLGEIRARCFNQTLKINSVEDLGADLLGSPGIVGEADGLLLVQKYPKRWNLGDVYIWNPYIRKQLLIPPPLLAYPMVLCLGFDPSTNDYKVANIDDESTFGTDFEIFSVNAGLWSSGNGSCRLMGGAGKKKVSLAGSVHWIGCKVIEDDDADEGYEEEISKEFVSFNLVSKKISSTLVPYDTNKQIIEEVPVVVAGSLIGLLKYDYDFDEVDIWVLGQDGGGWSHRFMLRDTYRMDPVMVEALYLNKDGMLIAGFDSADKGAIYAYDMNTWVESDVSDYCPWRPAYIGAYAESLLLLNQRFYRCAADESKS